MSHCSHGHASIVTTSVQRGRWHLIEMGFIRFLLAIIILGICQGHGETCLDDNQPDHNYLGT